jgi:hypothetical protein
MTDQNLGTYSPDDILTVISVGEISHIVSGYAEGTLVSVARVTPSSTYVTGGDNTGLRVFRKNDSGMITLTLMQSTSSNDVLNKLWQLDKDTRDNSWLFNITVIDGTGRSVYHGSQSFIENLPESGFGVDGTETRTWVIYSRNLEQNIGGNAKIADEVLATLEAMGSQISDRWKQ